MQQIGLYACSLGFGLAQIKLANTSGLESLPLQAQIGFARGQGLLSQLCLRIKRAKAEVSLRYIGPKGLAQRVLARALRQQARAGRIIGARVAPPKVHLVTGSQPQLPVVGIGTRSGTECT